MVILCWAPESLVQTQRLLQCCYLECGFLVGRLQAATRHDRSCNRRRDNGGPNQASESRRLLSHFAATAFVVPGGGASPSLTRRRSSSSSRYLYLKRSRRVDLCASLCPVSRASNPDTKPVYARC